MVSIRTPDLINGFDDIAALLPQWLTPLYWFLIVFLSLLAALINAGQRYVSTQLSTAKSTILLIALDSIISFALVLSALLLLFAALISKPWQSISPAFLAPMATFIAACLYAHSVKIHESRSLTLWLRASSMIIVNNLHVDADALFHSLDLAALPEAALAEHQAGGEEEDVVIGLIRSDTSGGLTLAARNKGSRRPALQALKMWWQQGSAQKLPNIWIRRRVNNRMVWHRTERTVTHASTIRRLETCGRRLLNRATGADAPPVQKTRMKVMTVFNRASRHVVHAAYGDIWMRASGQAGLDKTSPAWWFIGAEIVQALKAAVGLKFLTGDQRYQNVPAMWEWVELLGFEFRRDMQTGPIAEVLGKQNGFDGKECAVVAGNLAIGIGVQGVEEGMVKVGVEANVVACLGLAVSACLPELEKDLEGFNGRAVDVVQGGGARVGRDRNGNVSVAGLEAAEWPEHELALMIVQWISDGCKRCGRPGAPSPVA